MMQPARPRSMRQHISTHPVGQELLVYDETRHKAFCLNATSAAIWQRCDGEHTIPQIAAAVSSELAAPITEDLVVLALQTLQADGLILADTLPPSSTAMSRRQLVQRLGAGAAMLLPVVAAVMAPSAAQAYNGCVNCTVTPPVTPLNRRLAAAPVVQVPTSSPNSANTGNPTIFNP